MLIDDRHQSNVLERADCSFAQTELEVAIIADEHAKCIRNDDPFAPLSYLLPNLDESRCLADASPTVLRRPPRRIKFDLGNSAHGCGNSDRSLRANWPARVISLESNGEIKFHFDTAVPSKRMEEILSNMYARLILCVLPENEEKPDGEDKYFDVVEDREYPRTTKKHVKLFGRTIRIPSYLLRKYVNDLGFSTSRMSELLRVEEKEVIDQVIFMEMQNGT